MLALLYQTYLELQTQIITQEGHQDELRLAIRRRTFHATWCQDAPTNAKDSMHLIQLNPVLRKFRKAENCLCVSGIDLRFSGKRKHARQPVFSIFDKAEYILFN